MLLQAGARSVSLVTALTVLCGSHWTPALLREPHPGCLWGQAGRGQAGAGAAADWPASSLVLLHGSELLNVLQTRTLLPTIRSVQIKRWSVRRSFCPPEPHGADRARVLPLSSTIVAWDHLDGPSGSSRSRRQDLRRQHPSVRVSEPLAAMAKLHRRKALLLGSGGIHFERGW